jgi:hypothetical protein
MNVNTKASLKVAPVDAHGNVIPIGSKVLEEFSIQIVHNGWDKAVKTNSHIFT